MNGSFIEKKTIDEFLDGINKRDNSIFLTNEERKSSLDKSYNAQTNVENTKKIEETPYRYIQIFNLNKKKTNQFILFIKHLIN